MSFRILQTATLLSLHFLLKDNMNCIRPVGLHCRYNVGRLGIVAVILVSLGYHEAFLFDDGEFDTSNNHPLLTRIVSEDIRQTDHQRGEVSCIAFGRPLIDKRYILCPVSFHVCVRACVRACMRACAPARG